MDFRRISFVFHMVYGYNKKYGSLCLQNYMVVPKIMANREVDQWINQSQTQIDSSNGP